LQCFWGSRESTKLRKQDKAKKERELQRGKTPTTRKKSEKITKFRKKEKETGSVNEQEKVDKKAQSGGFPLGGGRGLPLAEERKDKKVERKKKSKDSGSRKGPSQKGGGT